MGGGKSSPPEVKPVDPTAQAQAQVDAQLSAIPQAAQLNYDVLTNPQYGLQATTQAYELARQNIYPQETAVRNQLTQNVLGQLQSPTGYTPEQQAAIDAIRGKATQNYTEQARTRANLSGGLFGGRSQNAEEEGLQELQNQFTATDIGRLDTNRLNSQQAAMAILSALYPDASIQSPNYINPVADPNTAYSATANANQTNANLAMQQYQADQQLRSSLFSALGQAGGAVGAAALTGGASIPASVASKSSWNQNFLNDYFQNV